MGIMKKRVAAYIRVSTNGILISFSEAIPDGYLPGFIRIMVCPVQMERNGSDSGGSFVTARRGALIGSCVNPFLDLPEIRLTLCRL